MLPTLTTVSLNLKQILHKNREPIQTVYFPGGGVCSITNIMDDGRMVEVSTIGREGFVGITAFTGDGIALGDAFVRVPNGEGQSMSVEAFRQELNRRGAFYDVIARYSQAHLALVMQSIGFSIILGVRRPTITLVLGTLHKAGIVDIGSKKITVLDRKRLQKLSCECYRVVKDTFTRLLPDSK